MNEERYIDLDNKKKVVLTDNDVAFIRDNPHGLTLEGVKVEKQDWLKHSKNRYMQARYLAMEKNCKSFTKSGKMNDGRTVLSRDVEGKPKWAEWIDTDYNRYPLKSNNIEVTSWESLPKEKQN
jgi:hypothetical protein